MALAGGNQPDAPRSRWRRILQLLGFGVLLCRLLVVGLSQWIVQRWIVRNPNIG